MERLLAETRRHFGAGWSLPEYRQVELYTKRKKLEFGEDPAPGDGAEAYLGVHLAVQLLESHLLGAHEELMEGLSSWERYLALPRRNGVDKLVAEVYRILRIFRVASLHRDGHMECHEGLIRISCTFRRCALSLNITPAGLSLLESFVYTYLGSSAKPYGEAYVERLLLQYFIDIVAEIGKFADEDRILYQFRNPGFFNRHFRFDCDNPRLESSEGHYCFDIGATYADPVRYPIDFFFGVADQLHIVPVEALKNGRLAESELSRWLAREPYQTHLPAAFRQRFGREVMVVGLPMT
ncbi:MAG: hypothetical protein PHT19_15385 [Methylococcus sp.]|nr:hypothetical protein [Methylococcus sp.]